MMKHTHPSELLAPAGSADAAWAAFHYGADAVYAGLPRFSARAEAVNFSTEQLDELIGFAHAHHRKVYITFNTLVQQNELPAALESLARIDELNADGVIVQDMGVARMARRFFPGLELHASTQLAVHNLDGAKQLAELGFSRVVLARELSLNEIKNIARNCGIETEVFIHGALCYSYSGLCLFSSHLTGRSGNRGRCAYCCRQNFDDRGEKKLPFSMKDFAVGPYFDELLETGVASLKIEGRMKSPEYVGAVTDFYRKRLQNRLTEPEQKTLLSDIQTIFGRPATDLYLKNPETNPIGPTTNGHRGAIIGTIGKIKTENGEHWLCFKTSRALQKFDGLKIEMPGTEPFGFSAAEIRLSNDRKKHLKFEIPPESEIEVKLPGGHPFLEPGQTLYCSISQEVRQRYKFEAPRPGTYRQKKPADISIQLKPGGIQLNAVFAEEERRRDAPVAFRPQSTEQKKRDEGVASTLPSSRNPISVSLNSAEKLSEARQPDKTIEAIRKCFEKTGETEWETRQLEIADNGLFVPASILNEARRTLLEKLSAEYRAKKQLQHFSRLEQLALSFVDATPASRYTRHDSVRTKRDEGVASTLLKEHWSIKLRDPALLDELTEEELARIDEIILEGEALSEPNFESMAPTKRRPPIRYALPVIRRNPASRILHPVSHVEIANIGALKTAEGSTDISADWPLYTLNSEAAQQWAALGIQKLVLSPEDTGDNLKALIQLLGDRAIVPVYQHTPLMISANRPDSGDTLSDRKNQTLRIEKNGDLFVLFFEAPFSLVEHLSELRAAGARSFRIDLTYGVADASTAAEIIRRIFSGQEIPGSYDGNFSRAI